MNTSSKWYMAGTEGTGKYVVVAQNSQGRVGYRPLSGDFRVRFEPSEAVLGSYSRVKEIHDELGVEWNYPNGQKRFSIVVDGVSSRDNALADIAELMASGDAFEINPAADPSARAVFGDTPSAVAAPAEGNDELKALLVALGKTVEALSLFLSKK